MGVLKRKQESEAVTLKLPTPLKREIEELKSRAEAAGFDLPETISAAMWRLCKQVRGELDGVRSSRKTQGRSSASVENLS